MKREEYHQFLIDFTKKAIRQQGSDGGFPPGNNGPHKDRETRIRTTSYWLYTMCYLLKQEHNEFESNAHRAADFLISKKCRPFDAAFYCRQEVGKDSNNGLVGQAWVIECLLYASKILMRDELLDIAKDTYIKHKWSNEKKAWHNLEVDGQTGEVNKTFNQQLWFAAVGCLFSNEYDDCKKMAEQHMESIKDRLVVYKDGVINHDSVSYSINNRNILSIFSFIKKNGMQFIEVVCKEKDL